MERLATIPAPLLAWLLDLVGPPGELSIRTTLGDPVEPTVGQRVELAVHGFTESPDSPAPSARFARIAERLLDPSSLIDVRLWLGTTTTWTTVSLDERGGLTVTEANGMVSIAGPVDDADLAALIGPTLAAIDATGERPGVELEAHLSGPTAGALATLMDLVRARTRQGLPIEPILVDRVIREARRPAGVLPPGSMRLQTMLMSRAATPPTADAVEDGIAQLARLDFVHVHSGAVTIAPQVIGVAQLLPMSCTGMRWQRRSFHREHQLTTLTDRIIDFGHAGLIVEVAPGAEGHVVIRTNTPADVRSMITHDLAIARMATPA